MLRRVSKLPQVVGRRYFAAMSQLAPGDAVIWVDPIVLKHNYVPSEQPAQLRAWYGTEWHAQAHGARGTVVEVDKTRNVVKVDFPGVDWINGTQECSPSYLTKAVSTSFHNLKLKTHDGKAFDTSVLKDKVVVIMNIEDKHCATDSSWLNLKRLYLKFASRAPRDQIAIVFFPNFRFDQPASFFEQKLGLPLGKGIYVMEKADVNGKSTQPAYQFLKYSYPGRIDWRWTQASKQTSGWNAPKFVLDRAGEVSQKVMGGPWKDLWYILEDEVAKDN